MSAAIGLIGLGAMGWPMGQRLAAAGHEVTVLDLDSDRVASFVRETGATGAATPAEVAARSDVIITMLPTSKHVGAVLLGEAGVLASARPGLLILEMSSGAPAETRELARHAETAGCRLVDAPVSGGVPRAKTGELAIMVGGDAQDIERARPILGVMGTTILPTGAVGSAHAMKALNNLVSAATFLATVEALAIGKQAGLDPARMVDIINVSTGMSNSSQKKMHQFVLSGSYASGFGLDLMVKDLTTARDIAESNSVASPFLALCKNIWAEASQALGSGQDHTALARFIERSSGVSLTT